MFDGKRIVPIERKLSIKLLIFENVQKIISLNVHVLNVYKRILGVTQRHTL